MLRTLVHDDVAELRFTTRRSRSMGFRVSAFTVRGVLIDSGFPDCAGDLARYVAATPPEGCVLTHWHEDHAGGAAALARAGVPLWMDARTAERVRTQAHRPVSSVYLGLVVTHRPLRTVHPSRPTR